MIKKHTAVIAAFISLASFTTINASAADNSTALSHSSGYYDNSQLVTVVNYDDETDIYFTTAGSKPGTDSALYDGTPISVSENNCGLPGRGSYQYRQGFYQNTYRFTIGVS